MHNFLRVFISILMLSCSRFAYCVQVKSLNKREIEGFFNEWWELSRSHKKEFFQGKSISTSNAESFENKQTLDLKVAAIHPDSCQYSVPRLAYFEKYKHYLSLVKKSRYKDEQVYLFLDSSLLPFAMSIEFETKPIKEPGDYRIMLKSGIFPGLVAHLKIRPINMGKEQCLFAMHASWSGDKTKIPDFVLESFTLTLSKKALSHLIRKTRY